MQSSLFCSLISICQHLFRCNCDQNVMCSLINFSFCLCKICFPIEKNKHCSFYITKFQTFEHKILFINDKLSYMHWPSQLYNLKIKNDEFKMDVFFVCYTCSTLSLHEFHSTIKTETETNNWCVSFDSIRWFLTLFAKYTCALRDVIFAIRVRNEKI